MQQWWWTLTFAPKHCDRVVGLNRVGDGEVTNRRLPGGVSLGRAGPAWTGVGQLQQYLLLAGLVLLDPLLELVLGDLTLLAEIVDVALTRHGQGLKLFPAPVLE